MAVFRAITQYWLSARTESSVHLAIYKAIGDTVLTLIHRVIRASVALASKNMILHQQIPFLLGDTFP